MKTNLSRRGLLAALTSLVAAGAPVWAADDKLTLKSAYSKDVLVDGARQVLLTVTPDGKGGGSGLLTFDPNIRDALGVTQIAIQEFPVGVRLIRDDEHAAKGRRLYELKRIYQDDRLRHDEPSWVLVVPDKTGAPCSLMFVDKDGKVQDVLMME